MSAPLHLLVDTGLHAGASIALSGERAVRIGSAATSDLILADLDVKPHHATVQSRGDRLLLQPASEGVTVFGHVLRVGVKTMLRHGATFRLGDTYLTFTNGSPLTERARQRAESTWLRGHAPLTWVRRRLKAIPRYAWVAVVAVLLALPILHGAGILTPTLPAPQRSVLEQVAFRHVRMRLESPNGVRIYEGYVQTVADLSALTLAVRANNTPVRVRVAVIDSIRDQLSDFLDKYYRGAQVQLAEQPGAFISTPPAADGYLNPDAWDYVRIARLAAAQVDGLRSLTFAGHENDSGPARVPLEAVGLNLLSTTDASWLVDQQGKRFFAGARVTIGRIDRVDKCGATIVREDGSIYRLFPRGTRSVAPC